MTARTLLVKILTSSKGELYRVVFQEVIKVSEFLVTMVVIALVFVAATVLVALLAGGLVRLRDAFSRRKAGSVHQK